MIHPNDCEIHVAETPPDELAEMSHKPLRTRGIIYKCWVTPIPDFYLGFVFGASVAVLVLHFTVGIGS